MKLVDENDPVLRRVTPYFDFTSNIDAKKLADDLHETLEKIGDAVGLAAPQVGLSLRVFVLNTGEPISCFNPEVISSSDDVHLAEEGCLSFPDLWLKIKRPVEINVKFQDKYGNVVYEKYSNLEARAFLHELNHLDGILFTTKVSPLLRERAFKRRNNLRKKS